MKEHLNRLQQDEKLARHNEKPASNDNNENRDKKDAEKPNMNNEWMKRISLILNFSLQKPFHPC